MAVEELWGAVWVRVIVELDKKGQGVGRLKDLMEGEIQKI